MKHHTRGGHVLRWRKRGHFAFTAKPCKKKKNARDSSAMSVCLSVCPNNTRTSERIFMKLEVLAYKILSSRSSFG
jgi:hypothetical protein